MKKIMMFFLGASLFIVNSSTYAQTTYYTAVGIPESATLTLRAQPSHASQALSNIPHNSNKIKPTGQATVDNENKWLQVVFENQVGWVKSTYITPSKIEHLPQRSQQPREQPIAPQPVASSRPNPAVAIAQQTHIAPTQIAVPWSASADSIYHDPHAKTQQPNIITNATTPHSNPAPEVDLRNESIVDSRYKNVGDTTYIQ